MLNLYRLNLWNTLGCVLIACLLSMAIGCGSPLVKSPSRSLSRVGFNYEENVRNQPATGSAQPANHAPMLVDGLQRLPAGNVLSLPTREPEAYYHEVISGETLYGISKKYGISVEKLLEANGLDNSVILPPGQLIYVPAAKSRR